MNQHGTNRRGVSVQGAMITLVLFVALAVILIIIYKSLYDEGYGSFTDGQCRSSLMLTKIAADIPKDFGPGHSTCFIAPDNPIPLKCSRSYVTVTDTVVKKNGKDVTYDYNSTCPSGYVSKSPTQSQDACMLESVITTEMAHCWQVFYEGKQPLLQQAEIGSWRFWRVKSLMRACYVCSEVTVSSSYGVTNIVDYTDKIKRSDGATYTEYFGNGSCGDKVMPVDKNGAGGNCWLNMMTSPPEHAGTMMNSLIRLASTGESAKVEPGKTYAVMFVRQGLGSCSSASSGDDKPDSYLGQSILVVPADEVPQQCSAVVS